jgi:hypothetical protein
MVQFVAEPGHHLVILLGNHDLELAYANVQEALLTYLAGQDGDKRSRVLFATSGTGVRCLVGHDEDCASVLCIHGNEFDKWNVVSPESMNRLMRAALYDKTSDLLSTPPNAGTKLVKDVMNAIKRDWPFVDLLKPEIESVFNILIALEPKRITAIAGVAMAFSRAATQGAYGVSHVLSAPSAAPASDDDRLSVTPGERFAEFLADGQDGDMLASMWKLSADPNVTPEELASGDEVLGVGRTFLNWIKYAFHAIDSSPRKALRAALADWGGGQEAWQVDGDCPIYDALAKAQPQADVVVAGHTHLRRQKRLPAGSLYLNTGTWARLMRLTEKVLNSEKLFGDLWAALPAGSKNRMPDGVLTDQPTVAVIRPHEGNGVRAALCEFKAEAQDGFQLVDGVNWENVGRSS